MPESLEDLRDELAWTKEQLHDATTQLARAQSELRALRSRLAYVERALVLRSKLSTVFVFRHQ